jgi:hypothetical protein
MNLANDINCKILIWISAKVKWQEQRKNGRTGIPEKSGRDNNIEKSGQARNGRERDSGMP